ncbi:MAG: capsular biosynthesis protein [Proteobacteria bacterium]|nr:MAG: capsular biosynthesis protein [Pseudomonadota bacterium]
MAKRGKLVVDIDGTLCPIKTVDENYSDLVPFPAMVKMLRAYAADGFEIVLHTARNMKTYEANLGLINKHTGPVLTEWLEKWEIPYDELYLGKPWPGVDGFYVDDRAVRPDEFLKFSRADLEKIMADGRASLKHGSLK